MRDIAIKRILKYKEIYDLSSEQSLYLILKYLEHSYPLLPKEVVNLMDHGILEDDGSFVENLDTINTVNASEMIINKPIFENEFNKEVYLYLKRRLCFKNPFTGQAIAKNPKSIKKEVKKRLEEYDAKCLTMVKKEKNYVGVYNTYLALFPTIFPETHGNPDNEKWVTFFGVGYAGVNLRKKVRSNAYKVMRFLKKHDAGIFLYGLYLFVRNGIRGKDTFIGSQKTFMEEVDVWYEQAEIKLDEAKSVEELFKGKKSSSGGTKGGVTL